MAACDPLRAQRLPAALPRPVRTLGPAQAGRGRPRGRLVHLRERRGKDQRRQTAGPTFGCGAISAGSTRASTKTSRRPTTNCCYTARSWRTRRCLVVCDMDRFEVHTNFTDTAKEVHVFDLAGLADFANREILRKLFDRARDAASRASPARRSPSRRPNASPNWPTPCNQRGIEPLRAAHFLMKLMFCMFGEDTGLLPRDLFGKLLERAKANPAMLPRRLESLFKAMAYGGDYGNDTIPWFNGGLFADADVIPLTARGDQLAGRWSAARIGRASSPRSSARFSSGRWTLPSVRRSAPTTPAGPTSKHSSSRSCWPPCSANGRKSSGSAKKNSGPRW